MGCRSEAGSLAERSEAFAEDNPDVPFSYIIGIYQDSLGGTPDESEGQAYWADIDEPEFPVTADTHGDLIDATPFAGDTAAGKCVLSPTMEILGCRDGHGAEDWAHALIFEDAN